MDLKKLLSSVNHHHNLDCKCQAQVELQFGEVIAQKVKLDKKCDLIQAKMLEDLELNDD